MKLITMSAEYDITMIDDYLRCLYPYYLSLLTLHEKKPLAPSPYVANFALYTLFIASEAAGACG